MASAHTAIKQTAKAAWLILSRALLFTAFGLIFNWGLFAAMGLGIWGRYYNVGSAGAHASGPGAILALALIAFICSRAVLLTAVFLIVFPILYFLAGKTRGIQSALAYLATDNRAWIHGLLKPVFKSALQFVNSEESKPGQGSPGGRAKAIANLVSKGVDKIEGLPRPLRWLLKGILKKLKITRLISEMNGLKQNGESEDAVLARLQVRIDEGLDEKMKPGWGGPAVLLGVNAIFAAAVHWLARK